MNTVYLGFRPPPYSNNSVFDKKIRAKNASQFEQNCDVRTLGLGTEGSRVESKRTSRSISHERKEPSGTKTHSAAPCAPSRTVLSVTSSQSVSERRHTLVRASIFRQFCVFLCYFSPSTWVTRKTVIKERTRGKQ